MPVKKKLQHITDAKQLEKITVAGKVLAELRGVTSRSIERGADPDDENYIGIKKVEHGKYEARHSLFVMFRDLVRQVDEAKNSNNSAKETNLLLDAEKKQLALAEQKKELIKVDDVVELFERLSSTYKNKFPQTSKALTIKVMGAKDDKEVNKLINDRDNELLNAFATTITITLALS